MPACIPSIRSAAPDGRAELAIGDELFHLDRSLSTLVEAAAARTYRVTPGESLWRIAARTYGDPLLWPEVLAANAESIDDPDRIRPGQVLLLPTPAR